MTAWRQLISAILAVAAFAWGAPALAQVPDPQARELAHRLTHAEQALAEQGYARAAGPFGGGVTVPVSARIALTLRAGQDYRIVAACDETCALDARLFDPNGAVIAGSGPEAGAIAIHVRPSFTGAHHLEINARRCQAAACWYAVNVYAR